MATWLHKLAGVEKGERNNFGLLRVLVVRTLGGRWVVVSLPAWGRPAAGGKNKHGGNSTSCWYCVMAYPAAGAFLNVATLTLVRCCDTEPGQEPEYWVPPRTYTGNETELLGTAQQ